MSLTTNEVRALRLLADHFDFGMTEDAIAEETAENWPAVQRRLGPLMARGLIFRGALGGHAYYITDRGANELQALEAA